MSVDLLAKYSGIFDAPVSLLMLFSQKLESNSVSERIRSFVASKIVKIMDWLAAKDSDGDKC